MTTPAGWYPDPERPGQQRYWDGKVWTTNKPATSMDHKPPPRPDKTRRWWILMAVGGVMAVPVTAYYLLVHGVLSLTPLSILGIVLIIVAGALLARENN